MRSWNVYIHEHWLGVVWADDEGEALAHCWLQFGVHGAGLYRLELVRALPKAVRRDAGDAGPPHPLAGQQSGPRRRSGAPVAL